MPNTAVIVPHVENELVRDYLRETKGPDPIRRYVAQLDIHISQAKDWNALHRAINDRKHKDAKQIVFGYMDKDKADERRIVEVVLNQLDPKAHRNAGAIMEIHMIDDHRVSTDDGIAWPEHVCRIHLEVPIEEADWGNLRDALRDARRSDAYELVSKNIDPDHLTDSLKAAIQAALGYSA